MRKTILLGFLTAVLAGIPSLAAAQAAPQYLSSEPEDGAKLHKAPEQVTVAFSEPLDSSSKLIVENHCGDRLDDKKVQISVNEMSVGIAEKPGGHYIVTYAAVGPGGLTGTNTGSFTFHVHSGAKCSGTHQHTGPEETHEGHEEKEGHEGHQGNRRHEEHAGGSGHEGHSDGNMPGEHTAHEGPSATEHHRHDDGNKPLTLAEQRKRRYDEIATGESAFPPLAPDTPAVFMSLGLAAGFGLIGGWVLRVSSPK